MKVLIIGATGSTGRILLEKALQQGHQATALARNPSAAVTSRVPSSRAGRQRARSRGGGGCRGGTGRRALGAGHAQHVSPRPSLASTNLVDAMKKHDVRRLVYLTGVGAGDSKGHVGFLYDRIFLPLS